MTAWQIEILSFVNKEMAPHFNSSVALVFERLLIACSEVAKDPTKIDRVTN